MKRRIRAGTAWVLVAMAGALGVVARGQEVRRAEPVTDEDVPTARAVPFEPAENPTPTPRPRLPEQEETAPGPGEIAPAEAPREAVTSVDQQQLEYANGFYAREMWDMAAPEYEKYLGSYPTAALLDREAAMFRLGECYRKLGNVNAAKNAYQMLLLNFAIGQFIGPAAYRLADIYYAAKDYDGALDYYRKAAVRMTDPAVVLAAKFYGARCLEGIHLPSEAQVTYEDIIATKGINPYREASRLALADILTGMERKDEALGQYLELAKEATKSEVKAEALVKAALLQVDLGQGAKAQQGLQAALALPDIGEWKPVAEIAWLRVLYGQGQYRPLLNCYDKVLAAVPDDLKPEVVLLAANSLRQLKEYAKASELYDEIVRVYPSSSYADEAKYEYLVSLYNSNAPELIAAVNKYLDGKPDPMRRDQVRLLKTEALFAGKKYDLAAAEYEGLEDSTLEPGYRSNVMFKLGWCYMQTQQPDKAIDVLTKFLKDYPLNKLASAALAQRAVAYQQTKDLNSALKDFDELLNDYPLAKERELALQQKALILGEQQDNAGMSATFHELLEEYPKSPAAAQAYYWIGSAAFSAKDYKACIEPLENARKLDRAQYYERATVRIIAAYYTLEDRDALAREVDSYNASKPADKVHPDVLRYLGKSFLEGKDYATSEKYLQELVAGDGATAADWLELGEAQAGARHFEDAVGSINKYLETQTEPAAKAKGLLAQGRAQLELGHLDEAQAAADQACALQPEGLMNAQGRMLSGDIQMTRGNMDDAAKLYQSIAVIIDDPQVTPAAMEKAYECLNRQGKNAEASKLLNTLETKYPEYQMNSGRQAGQ